MTQIIITKNFLNKCKQNTHGILLQNIYTTLGLFWDDFPKQKFRESWTHPPTSKCNSDFLNFVYFAKSLTPLYFFTAYNTTTHSHLITRLNRDNWPDMNWNYWENGLNELVSVSIGMRPMDFVTGRILFWLLELLFSLLQQGLFACVIILFVQVS